MSNLKDITGQTFGRLKVIERVEDQVSKAGNHKTMWLCKCSCGNEIITSYNRLKRGETQSCGCLARELTSRKCSKDIAGQKFGKLTAIRRVSEIGEPVKWECKCDCGNTCIVSKNNLGRSTKSCGCLKHKGTHKLSKTRLYSVWTDMKQRCYNPNEIAYKNYGERGIEVCNEWKNDFGEFYDWAINNGYSDNLEIDRINNNQNYSPDNCRWITHQEQQLNKRDNKMITYNGITKPLKSWTDELGIDYHKTLCRLWIGWSIEDAFNSTSEEHFQKYCANRHQMKPVVQYDLHMNIVREYQSIKEASETTGINYNGISKCCRGEICKSHGFIWHFKSNVKEDGI